MDTKKDQMEILAVHPWDYGFGILVSHVQRYREKHLFTCYSVKSPYTTIKVVQKEQNTSLQNSVTAHYSVTVTERVQIK